MVKTRNIVLAIILTFITCGIYSLYWCCKINNEINQLLGIRGTSGVMVIIYSIITCGIYGLYWTYKMGERVDELKGKSGGNTGLLYIIIALFGLGLVDLVLMQDAINDKVNGRF